MSDEPTLRLAVLEDPGADGPRLAYADFCAQQADVVTRARAELIRRQLELTHTPPRLIATGGANSLITAIAGLLDAHRDAWAAPGRARAEAEQKSNAEAVAKAKGEGK
jgi:uncharacterized protein (TIGR02996 family)